MISDILTPTFDRLLLKPDPVPDLDCGLIRPKTVTISRGRTGQILKLGPDCDPRFRVGQSVMHPPYDGRDMSLAGETVVHLSESSLIGVFKEGDMIEHTFEPMWDNLLVKDDEIPESLTAGLVRPSTAQLSRARSGVIVKVGGDVADPYRPGLRVIYGAMDGSDMTAAGKVKPEEGHRVISQIAILAYLDGDEDAEDVMGESWKKHILPCPGQMLVERAAQPLTRGLIIVPDGARLSSRSAEAIVVKAGVLDDFASGDRVFLSGSVAKNIPLGRREDIVLWVLRPREVTGRILADPGEAIDVAEHTHLAAKQELAREARDTSAFEEGDTRAPR